MPALDSTRDFVYWLADLWFGLKNLFEARLGLDDAALHLVAGPILYLSIVAPLRLRLASIAAWLVVLSVQLANEASDLYWSALKGDHGVAASTLDTAATMVIPTILLLSVRSRPGLWARLRASRSAEPSDQDEIARRQGRPAPPDCPSR